MRVEFSTYLDAVRFCAAICVVVAHFTFPQFISGVSYQGALGGVAVAIFFVLSGYVIAYTADYKEKTLSQYAISRLARIYSVAIPAIVLTVVVDLYLIRHGDADRFGIPIYEYNSLWKYLPVFLVFGSDIAGFHAPVLGDGVFWSLSYEVWYYITFAAFFYFRGLTRLLLTGAAVAILGIPALLYFPSWILGACIYRAHRNSRISVGTATAGALTTAAILIGLGVLGAYDFFDTGMNIALNNWPRTRLHNSMNFASHYVVAILTAAHIFFVRFCSLRSLSGDKLRKVITYMASFTFAIYLAHRPFMNFWASVNNHDPHAVSSIALLAYLVVISCWCFGLLSEKQKLRWRKLFRRILRALPGPVGDNAAESIRPG